MADKPAVIETPIDYDAVLTKARLQKFERLTECKIEILDTARKYIKDESDMVDSYKHTATALVEKNGAAGTALADLASVCTDQAALTGDDGAIVALIAEGVIDEPSRKAKGNAKFLYPTGKTPAGNKKG